MDAAQWHTRMTYYHSKPNAVRAVTDTLTSICCGSKVTAPSVKQLNTTHSTWHSVSRALWSDLGLPVESRALANDLGKTLHLHLNLYVTSADCFRSRNGTINPNLKRSIWDQTEPIEAKHHGSTWLRKVCLFSCFTDSLNRLGFPSLASNIVYSHVPCGLLP